MPKGKVVKRSFAIFAFASLVAAYPPRPVITDTAQVAYIYEDGTVSESAAIVANGTAQKFNSNGVIASVSITPVYWNGKYHLTQCGFQKPDNVHISAFSVTEPSEVAIDPHVALGYVKCVGGGSALP
ncbi:hypothetical protein PT974_01245 [Cladobotryum mycophilum]|uniref:Uncharacterized protein n=1 Tax=Cladobotryum mycophilum TaxID=491253 RepID=A0ABR0T358_9HYPO